MSEKQKAHTALFIATLLFGGNYWVSKILVDTLSPNQLVFFRTIGASILFAGVYFIGQRPKLNKGELLRLFFAAFFGIAINQLLFFNGLRFTSPVNTAIIHVSNPIIVLVLSLLFLHTKLSKWKIAGIFIGAIGASILILYQKDLVFKPESIKGNLMILGNTTAYAVFLVIMKPILKKYDTITSMFWVYLFGVVLIIPYTYHDVLSINWQMLWGWSALSLFYIIVLVTFGAYFLIIYALGRLSAPVVSFYIYLQPLIAAIIATIIGVESLNWINGFAAALIFSGVYLVNRPSKT
ncbi:MAG: EamA/RhaT family transporter [Bacteroidetes bacterium]|nr:MAG: EamA/RhaT family transporter [Bacteroidota bacterium]